MNKETKKKKNKKRKRMNKGLERLDRNECSE